MVMAKKDSKSLSIKQTSPNLADSDSNNSVAEDHNAGRLLQQRLKLVEELWETVLRSECPVDQAERLLRLKQLSDPSSLDEGEPNSTSTAIVLLIREMDLAEAIFAARAFSLYFQLVNILEQRIEEDSYLASMASGQGQGIK